MPELPEAERARLAIEGGALGRRIAHRERGGHCPRSGAELVRATVGGRTTYWCPAEQAATSSVSRS